MVPLLIFISIGVNFEAANSVQSELENVGIQLDNSASGAHREKVYTYNNEHYYTSSITSHIIIII